MKELHSYTIRLADGRLFCLDSPQVMGILNITPDSFYAGSRQQSEEEIGKRVRQIANEGASMLDIGAYSSRPGADDVPIEEEIGPSAPRPDDSEARGAGFGCERGYF